MDTNEEQIDFLVSIIVVLAFLVLTLIPGVWIWLIPIGGGLWGLIEGWRSRKRENQ